jgi:hypothetical protein
MSINPMQRVVVRVNCPPDITASQSPNELSQLDSFLGPRAMAIISIPLALRRAATSTMHRRGYHSETERKDFQGLWVNAVNRPGNTW